ncbi:MAG: FGGY family carbohydrate kinase, partial [Phototrophicaceae bacterium]
MMILIVDVGSSSTRAILYQQSKDGVVAIIDSIVRQTYQFDTDKSGQAVIDAVQLRYWVEACIDQCLAHDAIQDNNIVAVGMTTFAGNLLLLDADNHPLIPLDTYADTRSTDYIADLSSQVDVSAHHQRPGTLLTSAYYLPKLRYHAQTIAQSSVTTVCDFATYCYRHWFRDATPMSYSMASWSGMLNRETLTWDTASVTASQWSKAIFPKLADVTQSQIGLTTAYQKRWHALADVPFYLAIADGAAAQIGSGALLPNTATLTVGTTAAIRTVHQADIDPSPTVPDGCWSYRIDQDHHLIGGALSEGGNIFAWASQTLALNLETLENDLAQRQVASHGLTVLPLLNGERSPKWRADATGTIHGLRLSTTALDIVHALLESVALRLAQVATQLNLAPTIQMMAGGGALHHSSAFTQMIADALGRNIHLLDTAEVTAQGVAHLIDCHLNQQALTGVHPKMTQIYRP